MQSQHDELKKQHSDLEEEHRQQGEDFSRTVNDHKQKYLQLQREKEQELSKLKGTGKSNLPVLMEISTQCFSRTIDFCFIFFFFCMVIDLHLSCGLLLSTYFFVTFHISPYLFGLLREAEENAQCSQRDTLAMLGSSLCVCYETFGISGLQPTKCCR